jgi:hypothetical protein
MNLLRKGLPPTTRAQVLIKWNSGKNIREENIFKKLINSIIYYGWDLGSCPLPGSQFN